MVFDVCRWWGKCCKVVVAQGNYGQGIASNMTVKRITERSGVTSP